MTADPIERVEPVQLWGIVRGRDVGGEGAVELREDELRLTSEGRGAHRQLRFALTAIDGVRRDEDVDAARTSLTIYLANGDVVELVGGAELAMLGRRIVGRACTVAEHTLALRALGSQRGRPGSDHDRFFAPLLAARRRAETAASPRAQLAAFNARDIGEQSRRLIALLAAERFPRSAPDRRAVEAELLDVAAGLFAALDELRDTAEQVRVSDEETRFARWRDWSDAVRATFDQADRCWLAMIPALGETGLARSPRRGFWRRLFRRAAPLALFVALPADLRAQHATYRVPNVAAESLRAHGFDVVGVHDGAAFVVADSTDRARLAAAGWLGELVRRGGSAASSGTAGVVRAQTATTVYRSFDDPQRGVRVFLDSLARANPRVHVDSIGASYEGRPILAAKVGPPDDSPARPNVLYMATYHAREWAATEMALRLLRYLADPPAGDARIDSLLATRDIWIIPVENPDGYQYTFTTDRLWRKNRHPYGIAVGVDLNRNHSEHWAYDDNGSSPSPPDETYRGPSPASEPETRAIEQFHADHPPVMAVSYHTYAGLVIYPPGWDYGILPQDLGVFRALAGTDEHPSVLDRLPQSILDHYHPAPSWNLYPTNGEANDFEYVRYGTIGFTPEISSGCEGNCNAGYYGFEFPDDESRLQRLFLDNLPFALDVLEAARDPFHYRSPTTGLRSERVAIESVSPRVHVRVPTSATGVTIEAAGQASPLSYTQDTIGAAVYTRRLISAPAGRPAALTIHAGALATDFNVLAVGGAEVADSAWSAGGFAVSAGQGVFNNAWHSSGGGALRSPVVLVPADADTISVVLWTRYNGDGFSVEPHGELRLSRDGGLTFTVEHSVRGSALQYYTETFEVAGVVGKRVQLELASSNLPWDVDEIALVAHGRRLEPVAPPVALGAELAVRPSENPVRSDVVRFTWSAALTGVDLAAYDFAGRLVWHAPPPTVSAITGDEVATWRLADGGVPNGAYLLVMRAGGRAVRAKLYVARRN